MTDKSTISSIQKNYVIQAPLDEVWDCLSNSDISTFWQGRECIIGINVRNQVSLFDGWVTGEIIEIEPKKKLSYTWKVKEWDLATEPSKVTYLLEKIDEDSTKVELTHWNLPNVEERDSHHLNCTDKILSAEIKNFRHFGEMMPPLLN